MDGLLQGRDAKEWMEKNNVISPDVSQMIPYQVDNQTIFYFPNEERFYKFINKDK